MISPKDDDDEYGCLVGGDLDEVLTGGVENPEECESCS